MVGGNVVDEEWEFSLFSHFFLCWGGFTTLIEFKSHISLFKLCCLVLLDLPLDCINNYSQNHLNSSQIQHFITPPHFATNSFSRAIANSTEEYTFFTRSAKILCKVSSTSRRWGKKITSSPTPPPRDAVMKGRKKTKPTWDHKQNVVHDSRRVFSIKSAWRVRLTHVSIVLGEWERAHVRMREWRRSPIGMILTFSGSLFVSCPASERELSVHRSCSDRKWERGENEWGDKGSWVTSEERSFTQQYWGAWV